MSASFYMNPMGFQGVTAPNTRKQDTANVNHEINKGNQQINDMQRNHNSAARYMEAAVDSANKKDDAALRQLMKQSQTFEKVFNDTVVKHLIEQDKKKLARQNAEAVELVKRLNAGDPEAVERFKVNSKIMEAINAQYATQIETANKIENEIERQKKIYGAEKVRIGAIEEAKIAQFRKVLTHPSQRQAAAIQLLKDAVIGYPAWRAGVTSPATENPVFLPISYKGQNLVYDSRNYDTENDPELKTVVANALQLEYINNNDLRDEKGNELIDRSFVLEHLIKPIEASEVKNRLSESSAFRDDVNEGTKSFYAEQLDVSLQNWTKGGEKADQSDLKTVVEQITNLSAGGAYSTFKNNSEKKEYIINTITAGLLDTNVNLEAKYGINDIYDLDEMWNTPINIKGLGKITLGKYLNIDLKELKGKVQDLIVARRRDASVIAKGDYELKSASLLEDTLIELAKPENQNPEAQQLIKDTFYQKQGLIERGSNYFTLLDKANQEKIRSLYSLPTQTLSREETANAINSEFPTYGSVEPEINERELWNRIPNADPGLVAELRQSGRIVNKSYANLNDPLSPAYKYFESKKSLIEGIYDKAYGRTKTDDIIQLQRSKVVNAALPIATHIAKTHIKGSEDDTGSELGNFKLGLDIYMARIKADNLNKFRTTTEADAVLAEHKSSKYNDGLYFNVEGKAGMLHPAFNASVPNNPRISTARLGVFNQTAKTLIENQKTDTIGLTAGEDIYIFDGFENITDPGFRLSTADLTSIKPSKYIKSLEILDTEDRHWTQIYNLQLEKLGLEPIDWKSKYPNGTGLEEWEQLSTEAKQNLKSGSVADLTNLSRIAEANKQLPITYRVNVTHLRDTIDEPVPEINFNQELIHSAGLVSKTYSDFLNNPEDQNKASLYLTQKFLALASNKYDDPNVMIRAAVGWYLKGDGVNYNNIITKKKGGKTFWEQGDNPELDNLTMSKLRAYRSGNKVENALTVFIPATSQFGTQLSELQTVPYRQDIHRNVTPFVEREENLRELQEVLRAGEYITMPLAEALLGKDVVDSIAKAVQYNQQEIQQALIQRFEPWFK